MHSALFVTTHRRDMNDAEGFFDAVDKKVKPGEGVLRLAESVWLVSIKDQAASFAWLVSTAERFGVSYGILPFEHAPEWLKGSFDPKTIWGRRREA